MKVTVTDGYVSATADVPNGSQMGERQIKWAVKITPSVLKSLDAEQLLEVAAQLTNINQQISQHR